MAVLGYKEKQTKNQRLVGAQVPSSVYDYMTLHSLAKGVSKSTVFQTLLHKWVEKNMKTYSEEDLLKLLVQRINNRWKIEKANGKNNFDSYRKAISSELSRKGLTEEQVNYVLSNTVR